jgi:hypothetical protein
VSATGKRKRGPGKTALRSSKLALKYHALCFLAKLFEKPFWFFEQRRSWLSDRIENEESDR